MADLDTIVKRAVRPAYDLLPSRMASAAATVMLLSIGLQESRFAHRRQIGGPARGFWQFELGGVVGVMNHPATRIYAVDVCGERGIKPVARDVYNALEHDDVLAAAIARLNLWWDPAPLPGVSETEAAWRLYLRTWRPGKPHRKTWDVLHRQAVDVVRALP